MSFSQVRSISGPCLYLPNREGEFFQKVTPYLKVARTDKGERKALLTKLAQAVGNTFSSCAYQEDCTLYGKRLVEILGDTCRNSAHPPKRGVIADIICAVVRAGIIPRLLKPSIQAKLADYYRRTERQLVDAVMRQPPHVAQKK